MMTGQSHNRTDGDDGNYDKFFPHLPLFSELPKTGNIIFDNAMQIAGFHEGLYSNDPDDPGGATAWGWSLRTAKTIGDLDGDGFAEFDLDFDGDVDINDIIKLKEDPEKAINMYKKLYWDKHRYDFLPEIIAVKTFDLAINMGASQAHKLLQRSVRATGTDRLIDDGIIGKTTRKIITQQDDYALLCAYRSHAAGFYQLLANKRPKSRKYLGGWLNRAYF